VEEYVGYGVSANITPDELLACLDFGGDQLEYAKRLSLRPSSSTSHAHLLSRRSTCSDGRSVCPHIQFLNPANKHHMLKKKTLMWCIVNIRYFSSLALFTSDEVFPIFAHLVIFFKCLVECFECTRCVECTSSTLAVPEIDISKKAFISLTALQINMLTRDTEMRMMVGGDSENHAMKKIAGVLCSSAMRTVFSRTMSVANDETIVILTDYINETLEDLKKEKKMKMNV
jgi:hypothetical protein